MSLIHWNFKKSIPANLKSNQLQLIHYLCDNIMMPWKDTRLDKYLKNNIIGSDICFTMNLYEDDKCYQYTPEAPRTCIRTNILDYSNLTIKFSVSFNEEVDCKFFWIRDEPDIHFKSRDVLELHLRKGSFYVYDKHEDDLMIAENVDIYDKHSFEIVKEEGLVCICYNGEVITNYFIEFKDEYWFNLGIMNKLKQDNSINVFDFEVKHI